MANTNKLAYGLIQLDMADIGSIGSSTEWEQIGDVLEGSISLNFDTPTANEVRVEEKDTAVLTKYVGGSKMLELDIVNVSPEMLELICDAQTVNGITYFPDNMVVKKKMFRFTFVEGGALYITNGSMVTNPAGGITKSGSDVFQVHVSIGVNASAENPSGVGIGTYTPTT